MNEINDFIKNNNSCLSKQYLLQQSINNFNNLILSNEYNLISDINDFRLFDNILSRYINDIKMFSLLIDKYQLFKFSEDIYVFFVNKILLNLNEIIICEYFSSSEKLNDIIYEFCKNNNLFDSQMNIVGELIGNFGTIRETDICLYVNDLDRDDYDEKIIYDKNNLKIISYGNKCRFYEAYEEIDVDELEQILSDQIIKLSVCKIINDDNFIINVYYDELFIDSLFINNTDEEELVTTVLNNNLMYVYYDGCFRFYHIL